MKIKTLLLLVSASVLFTACGEEAKKSVTDAATSATNTVKETASKAMDATKAKVAEVSKTVSEKVEVAKEAASEELTEAKEVAKAIKEREDASAENETPEKTSAAPATNENDALKATFAKCAGCHGTNGKTKALGKSEIIAGQSAEELATKIAAYKAGTRNTSGMGTLMKSQVSSLDDAMIKALSEYISTL